MKEPEVKHQTSGIDGLSNPYLSCPRILNDQSRNSWVLYSNILSTHGTLVHKDDEGPFPDRTRHVTVETVYHELVYRTIWRPFTTRVITFGLQGLYTRDRRTLGGLRGVTDDWCSTLVTRSTISSLLQVYYRII